MPWFLQKEPAEKLEEECLEVLCRDCDGKFRKRTFAQEGEIDNLRPYNDSICPACGMHLNVRDADGNIKSNTFMHERLDRLHEISCVLAQCPHCEAQWQMKLFESSPRIQRQATATEKVAGAGEQDISALLPPAEPVQGLVDLVPEVREIKTERPLH